MEKLIESIMSMAKLEAGRERIGPDWLVDIAKELHKVKMAFRAEAKARKIKLILEIHQPLLVVWRPNPA